MGPKKNSGQETGGRTASQSPRGLGRKTDRRTLYTLGVIRSAFVRLVNRKSYARITVAEVCREAGVTRSTFYLHYEGLEGVLDDVLDHALQFEADGIDERGAGMAMDPVSPRRAPRFDVPMRPDRGESLLPACQRAASSPEYRALLMDPDLSEHIVARIADHERGTIVPRIRRRTGLSAEEAETLFQYMVHGSFAVNKRHGFVRDAQWRHEADMLDRFVQAGYRAFSRGRQA